MNEWIKESIADSEFYMWRAVLAFSMVNNILSLKKKELLRPYFSKIPFSQAQIVILRNNFKKPQNVKYLYYKITNPKDKEHFFSLARELTSCENDTENYEESILKKEPFLKKTANDDFLVRTNESVNIRAHCQQYAKVDSMGDVKVLSTVKTSA